MRTELRAALTLRARGTRPEATREYEQRAKQEKQAYVSHSIQPRRHSAF